MTTTLLPEASYLGAGHRDFAVTHDELKSFEHF
jgi:hypothetical protein